MKPYPENPAERAAEADPAGPKGTAGGPELSRPAGRRSLVRIALVFYAAMFGAVALWATLIGDRLFYASAAAERRGLSPLPDLAAGVLAAGVAILASSVFTRRTRWGERLARELGALLGRLALAECLLLAAASGVAEEAFFRGALQPRVGLVAASLIFGLAHFVPKRELAPWTIFSIGAGFLLGALFDATGNLLAPVVAHVLINAVNLRMIATRYA